MENSHKFIRVGFSTCYIFNCNEGYLLIDVGYPGDYRKFKQKLKKKYDIEVSEIKYLLLTHHHDDHAGFATEFVKKTGAKLIVHENAIERLKMGASEEDSKPINKRIKYLIVLFNHFHQFKFPSVFLTDNDIIIRGKNDDTEILKNLGINGRIIYTSGHTKDGISVLLSDGSVFCGDNAMNAWYFNIFGIKKRPIYVQDIDLIFESWEKYSKLGGKKIFPTHGRPFNIKSLKQNLKKHRK